MRQARVNIHLCGDTGFPPLVLQNEPAITDGIHAAHLEVRLWKLGVGRECNGESQGALEVDAVLVWSQVIRPLDEKDAFAGDLPQTTWTDSVLRISACLFCSRLKNISLYFSGSTCGCTPQGIDE
jgi:hypothetical protein